LTRKALRSFFYEFFFRFKGEKGKLPVSERKRGGKTHLTKFNVAVVHKEWENFVNLRKENENHNLFSS
jgi:hypothetical protein